MLRRWPSSAKLVDVLADVRRVHVSNCVCAAEGRNTWFASEVSGKWPTACAELLP